MTNTISKKEEFKRRRKKIEKIVFAIGLTAVIFVVATYAWFIGTTEISIGTFELTVESGDGLQVSLNGDEWNNTVTISEATVTPADEDEYVAASLMAKPGDHNNKWVSAEGLIPLSSVGRMQVEHSTLELFSKSSIVSLAGGYRLRSDKIQNTGMDNEQDGYVVFDLYIRNQSGDGYNHVFNHGDDEGVYLTTTSLVNLKQAGAVADGEEPLQSDLERSVRLAFMQIGRVGLAASGELIRDISCEDVAGTEGNENSEAVTGLCDVTDEAFPVKNGIPAGRGMNWNIWEPNDATHTAYSISHYDMLCRKRTTEGYTTDKCTALKADEYKITYAVNSVIVASDNVNVYDGADLNTYTGTISTADDDKSLVAMEYFTDTQKNGGDTRPEIFFLAPNSITKVRVYVYLEGQDVDNYDLGAAGKTVQITFGFTKDKFVIGADADDEGDEDDGGEPVTP